MASGESGTGRRVSHLVGMVLLNLGLACLSAYGAYAWLGEERTTTPAGNIALGTPRLIVATPSTAPSGGPRELPLPRPAASAAGKPARQPAASGPGKSPRRPAVAAKLPATRAAPASVPVAPPREAPAPQARADASLAPSPAAAIDAATQPESEALEVERAAVDAESVRMVVNHHLPQVRACYERALKQQPGLTGTVELRFAISEVGEASSASVNSNTTGHDGLGQCLAQLIRSWRYPRPVGGAIELVYPFIFSAGE